MCLGPYLLAVYTCSPQSGLGAWLYSLPTCLHHQLQVFAFLSFPCLRVQSHRSVSAEL
ncbi:unnamed protein product [Gulo gulo]|uniref:Uncharacterized protein n=1 Tax=Gulo gulo TaxID=48420 RepID=A0A9X9LF79_GULGU|nr:unnamed protein product [Gulo gulo]